MLNELQYLTVAGDLEDLTELRQLLETTFPDPEAGSEWLQTPAPMLHGRTPMALIRAGDLRQVIGLLAGLEAGAFA